MNDPLQPRPEDRPPQRESWGVGVTISIAAHLALLGALAWSVHWNVADEPEGVSAELWAAVPQVAAPAPTSTPPPPRTSAETPPPPAPRPPAPPPPAVATPTPPDIVTEKLQDKKHQREKQQEQAKQDKAKQDKARLDAEKAEKADKAKADAAKQQAQQKQLDAQKLAKLHDENVKRMMGQMDSPTTSAANSTGTADRNAGPSASYAGRIKARIRPNIVLTDAVNGNPSAEVEVRCAPDGTIIGRRITQSSGVKEWDEAVLRAIDRTGILPRDTDGRVPSPMLITFKATDAAA